MRDAMMRAWVDRALIALCEPLVGLPPNEDDSLLCRLEDARAAAIAALEAIREEMR